MKLFYVRRHILNINSIKKHIEQNNKIQKFSEFSVLIPLITVENKLHLLFERRAYSLSSQPGEICFPGGKKEDGETPSYSALRETIEELNISESQVEILNNLGYYFTPFNYKINIFLGHIKNVDIHSIKFNPAEVDSIFTVPLDQLKNQTPKAYTFDVNMDISNHFPYEKIENGRDYSFKKGSYSVYFYEYKDYVIWGITAQILKVFLDNIKELS
jgi:8-oxo-dGTP pyrophosphatase MutT (NUDIX family)